MLRRRLHLQLEHIASSTSPLPKADRILHTLLFLLLYWPRRVHLPKQNLGRDHPFDQQQVERAMGNRRASVWWLWWRHTVAPPDLAQAAYSRWWWLWSIHRRAWAWAGALALLLLHFSWRLRSRRAVVGCGWFQAPSSADGAHLVVVWLDFVCHCVEFVLRERWRWRLYIKSLVGQMKEWNLC